MRVQNQMLVLRAMVAGVLTAGALFAVSPAAADDGETCVSSSGDVAISACTRALASRQYTTQNVAALYTSRGIAYLAKGQHDRAIQDFGQVIRLEPQFTGGDKTNPVAVGAGQFVFCCRAILVDCRTKVSWAIRDIKRNTNYEQCIKTCWKKLSC
jgi:hypothetical protein